MDDRLIWFKGTMVPAAEARVHALSPTAQFGLNVFEGLRGYWNKAQEQLFLFRALEHLERLGESSRLIGFETAVDQHTVLAAIRECVLANEYREDIAIRVILFLDGEGTWSSNWTPDMLVAPIARSRSDPEDLQGLSACVTTWRRIGDCALPPRIKCGANYINGRHGLLEARRNGYDVPIFLDDQGKVTESAGSCIMIVRKSKLVTPPVTSSILEGITRDSVLELAEDLKLNAEVRPIDRTELHLAEEAFLCGSAAEITPLTSIDRFPIGDGMPGPLTTQLLKEYLAFASNERPGAQEWLTPIYPGGNGAEDV